MALLFRGRLYVLVCASETKRVLLTACMYEIVEGAMRGMEEEGSVTKTQSLERGPHLVSDISHTMPLKVIPICDILSTSMHEQVHAIDPPIRGRRARKEKKNKEHRKTARDINSRLSTAFSPIFTRNKCPRK